ncbi:MAG: polymorphic toxin type 50 domain-containing protein [Treponema sp.]
MRQKALQTAEREIVNAVQESINAIKAEIGTHGVLRGVGKKLNAAIEDQAVHFAAELDRILEAGLTRAAYAGLSIGTGLLAAHTFLQNSKPPAQQAAGKSDRFRLLNLTTFEKDLQRQAAAIAESTMHKKRVYNKREFILSERIWDLSGNNYQKIKEIIASGINTDCVKVVKALTTYVKEGAATFAKDYPDMYKRMGGRVPKNFNYEALRLARNELSEIYWQTTVDGFKDNPAIKAVKWLLSNNRISGFHDICDELAYADTHGLGAGIYPVDDAPAKPHICCLCSLAPVIASDLRKGDTANTPPENWSEIRSRIKKSGAFINTEELTEKEKAALHKKRHEAYQRRRNAVKLKQTELEQKLKTLHDNPAEYGSVYRERYGTVLNKGKQNRHIYGHKTVRENASYFKNDFETLQKIINEKAGTGKSYFERNELVEIIEDTRLNGYDIDKDIGKIIGDVTHKAKLHYSKKGYHIVPFRSRPQKEQQ